MATTNKEIISNECMLKNYPYDGNNLFTFTEWSNRGYKINKGEKAFISTRLWQQNTKINKNTGEKEKYFYLTKAFLFTPKQVTKMTDEQKKNIEIRNKIIRERAEKKKEKVAV